MSECSAWKKAGWRLTEDNQNPVISFADVMSEELADSIAEEDRRKGNDIVRIEKTINSEPVYNNDEDFARALQRKFDREYDLFVRLEQEKLKGNNTVIMTPDRYFPRTTQDSEQSSDDEETNQAAIDTLYSNLSLGCSFNASQKDGARITKHDATSAAKRNVDKALNDKIDLAVGDLRSAPINDHVFNSLCQFSKADTKRSHKLKDKEEKATMNISVDAITRLTLFKWINQGVFDRVEGVVATGKESAVLHAIKGNNDGEHIVIKVYKTSLTEFKNRSEYVDNDFRFKNPRRVLRIWAEREFMNLTRMIHHDLPCPVPLKLRKNLLVMSLIGEWGIAAPKLKNVSWEETISDDRKAIFIQVVNIMCNMYEKCHLVHGDLSEFNLLFSNKKVFVIDVSQSMDLSHPRSLFYLIRDVENILSFFQRIKTPDLPTSVVLFNTITGLNLKEEESLTIQVEQLLHHNHSIRAVKSKPADFEWTAYNCEKIRGESPFCRLRFDPQEEAM